MVRVPESDFTRKVYEKLVEDTVKKMWFDHFWFSLGRMGEIGIMEMTIKKEFGGIMEDMESNAQVWIDQTDGGYPVVMFCLLKGGEPVLSGPVSLEVIWQMEDLVGKK